MRTIVSTSIGELQVDMVDADHMVVSTPYVDGDHQPVTINGVAYTLRYDLNREDYALEYGYGANKTWRITSNYGKLSRLGWENWRKPVSDSAHKKARAAVNEAVIAVDNRDNADTARIDAARAAVGRIEADIAAAQREMDALLAKRLEALAELYMAEQVTA